MNWTKRDWGFCLILAVVTLMAYNPAWHGQLLWDDDNCSTPPELRSVDGLKRIWFQPRATAQYYPLLYTSYWIQQRVWGDSPTGYHLINLLLHIGCVVMLLRILRFLRIPGAELAVIIWALHPVNVETVAWIAERKNVLSGIFALAATLCYLKFDDTRGRRNYALAIGLFLFGLLSKTAIVALPLAWLVILWWKRGAISWRRDVLPATPFVCLSITAGLVTHWFEDVGIGDKSRILDLSLLDRCLIAGRAFWFQFSNLFWPSNLTFVYPRWDINAEVWWQYLFPIGVLGLLVILWSLRRWSRAPLAGVLVYILLLLPSLGFLNIYFFVYSFVADHWQYLACLGIIVPCASGIALLAGRKESWRDWLEPAITLVLGGVLFVLTWQQSRMYTDVETLYRTTIARNPGCWMAYTNLGDILSAANRLPEAMDLFNHALRIKPAVAHYSLGNAFIHAGRTSEAIQEYKWALQIDADYVEAHNNLGNALFLAGRTPEAMDEYTQALRINPNYAEAHTNLGNALIQTRRVPEAIGHYKQALRMYPNSASTHNNLGAALEEMGRIPEAVEQLKAALRINPGYTEARNNLAKLEALQKTTPPTINRIR
ncbi:MAG TPA: tetratricopeptide repeat protein [Candidatus Udaeobacter sp.]|nr:tetratricopeptide repeat protein [Candidatus Udaeobacter sp.]